ncbi:protein of unknown function [Nitrospira japonica]|uniref:Uncharacterized protein n=1 Tax=Nitrospira japonica TaxID=1325564 RepID=A0A1W1I3N3_9BACT|nr:protein of unknown function [Nitrospira japonica]
MHIHGVPRFLVTSLLIPFVLYLWSRINQTMHSPDAFATPVQRLSFAPQPRLDFTEFSPPLHRIINYSWFS